MKQTSLTAESPSPEARRDLRQAAIAQVVCKDIGNVEEPVPVRSIPRRGGTKRGVER